MRVLAWFLLILCSIATLSALWNTLFGDSSEARFLYLFLTVVYATAVYIAISYLFLTHTPNKYVVGAVAIINGIGALYSLTQEEVVTRVWGLAIRTFYCVGFLLLL